MVHQSLQKILTHCTQVSIFFTDWVWWRICRACFCLGLQWCFGLLITGDQDFTAQVSTCGRRPATANNNSGAIKQMEKTGLCIPGRRQGQERAQGWPSSRRSGRRGLWNCMATDTWWASLGLRDAPERSATLNLTILPGRLGLVVQPKRVSVCGGAGTALGAADGGGAGGVCRRRPDMRQNYCTTVVYGLESGPNTPKLQLSAPF